MFNWSGLDRFQPIGNGISWNVNEFSDQYTLTVDFRPFKFLSKSLINFFIKKD